MKTNPNDFANSVLRSSFTSYPSEGETEEIYYSSPGLTKREYFAALAMQSVINHEDRLTPEQISSNAVLLADALIEALNKEQE